MLTALKAYLDSAARSYLQSVDYHVYGVLIALILFVFIFWRHKRYDSWPSVEQCHACAESGLQQSVVSQSDFVFLATNPPAVDLVTNSLMINGLIVPIIVFGYLFLRFGHYSYRRQYPRLREWAVGTRRKVGKQVQNRLLK